MIIPPVTVFTNNCEGNRSENCSYVWNIYNHTKPGDFQKTALPGVAITCRTLTSIQDTQPTARFCTELHHTCMVLTSSVTWGLVHAQTTGHTGNCSLQTATYVLPHCIFDFAQWIQPTAYYTQQTAHCTVHTTFCKLDPTHYTLAAPRGRSGSCRLGQTWTQPDLWLSQA